MLRPDDFIKGQLVLYGWRCGHAYGGHLTAEAIMSVIANRVKLGWGGWLEVLAETPFRAAVIETNLDVPKVWSPEMSRLLHDVEGIFDSSSKDLSNGALYWFDSSKPVTNAWFKEKILNDLEHHPKVMDLNSLMFFR